METEERRATSRASFICHKCCKTFTDLEVGDDLNLAGHLNFILIALLIG